jgi:hypothetical protein
MLLAATLVVGCAHKTPEQKAAEKAQKQAVAQAKAERKAADKQAKAQAKAEKKRLAEEQDRAEAQAKAAKKQAEAQAKADKKQAEAQAKADKQRMEDERERAEAQAKAEQKRQAEEQKLAQQKAAAAERAAKEQADHDAFAQKQQAKMAMSDAKTAEKAKKHEKPAKPVTYPDDEEWVVGHPYIRPENHTRQTDRHFESMSAKGAVADATLYDQHFDGTELNALGRSKVALMLEAAPKHEPLTIYVPTSGSDERVQARLTAVNNFWKASQYAAIELQTKQGVNPNTATPAGTGLAALRRLDKESNSGSGGGSSSGVSASGGPGASGGSSGSSGR